jgi:hypothetical protein
MSFSRLRVLKIAKQFVPYLQQIALILSAAGLALHFMQYQNARQLLIVGLSILSAAYFVWTFLPVDTPPHSTPDKYSILVHRLIYLSCSVLLVGVLYTYFNLVGHHEMLLISGISLLVSLAAAIFLMIQKRENYVTLRDSLIRGFSTALLGLLALSLN